MLIKDEGRKVNFIDENDVFVGYDMMQSCCEYADWAIFDEPNLDFDPYAVELNQDTDVEGYIFDVSYFDDNSHRCGVSFKLVHEFKNDLYLYLFNDHNGYYSHGFEATVGGDVWQSDWI